jgi:hypothetical protein
MTKNTVRLSMIKKDARNPIAKLILFEEGIKRTPNSELIMTIMLFFLTAFQVSLVLNKTIRN